MATLWITDEELKQSTLIQDNVNNYLYDNDIAYCQLSKIESCLTTELIARIQAVVDGGVDADITTLLDDYIKPPLSLHTFTHALPNIAVRVTNKGVFEKGDGTNTSVGVDGVEYLARKYRDRAEFYTNRMIEYIEENPEKYPEQTSCGDCSQKEGFNFNLDYTGI